MLGAEMYALIRTEYDLIGMETYTGDGEDEGGDEFGFLLAFKVLWWNIISPKSPKVFYFTYNLTFEKLLRLLEKLISHVCPISRSMYSVVVD